MSRTGRSRPCPAPVSPVRGAPLAAAAVLLATSCGDDPTRSSALSRLSCTIESRFIADGGVGKDGIPALTNPPLVGAEPGPATAYLRPEDRVVGVVVEGQAVAVPHNVLWWHEIVNLEWQGRLLAVTYCPLTGSSLVFDRAALDGAELGVSGLLFQANLIMYDRRGAESLWPQMLGEARCGPEEGSTIPRFPAVETTWEGWTSLHPATRVVSGDLPFGRDYTHYPYGAYENLSSRDFLGFPMPPLDARRLPKERILGLPASGDAGAAAFPFLELEGLGDLAVVERAYGGDAVVVLWDARRRGAMAFRPRADGQPLTLEVTELGIQDRETGSRWSVDGRARGGPLAGRSLEPVAEAYVAFWGAWAAFFPDTELALGAGGGP